MTKDFLIDAISCLDEDLIARFINIDAELPAVKKRRLRGSNLKIGIIAAAAFFALAVGMGFSSVHIMKMMSIIGGGSATTDIITDELPDSSFTAVVVNDEKIDLNSDGISDKIEVKLSVSAPKEACIGVIDGRTGNTIWTGSMPVSENERYAYYFSNSLYGEDRLICWSYSVPSGGGSLTYRCEMFNFDETGQRKDLANTEYTFDFSDGHAPYESEEEYLSKLFANLNENLNGDEIKGYVIVDNTGDELVICGENGIKRKTNIRYTLAELLKMVSN